MKIVVARYNEDVQWAQLFPNVIIYNKGITLGSSYNEILLPNVGREAHTYYHHIYENYDTLDDYTIFLQGSPFHHSPNIIKTLWKYIINPPKSGFQFISEWMVESNIADCPHQPNIGPLMKDIYEELFGERKEWLPLIFGGGAQFIVSKEAVYKHPRDFYLKIIKRLDYDMCTNEACVFERFHKIIFS